MYRSAGRTALGGTSRHLRDHGRRMLGEPLGSPAWILLLCWGLVACCTGAMALQPPSITTLRMPAELPRPGESVTVSCEALSELPEMTLLYWLENGFFVESLHPDGAVREGTVQVGNNQAVTFIWGKNGDITTLNSLGREDFLLSLEFSPVVLPPCSYMSQPSLL